MNKKQFFKWFPENLKELHIFNILCTAVFSFFATH